MGPFIPTPFWDNDYYSWDVMGKDGTFQAEVPSQQNQEVTLTGIKDWTLCPKSISGTGMGQDGTRSVRWDFSLVVSQLSTLHI